ncbi:MAG: phosphate acyltransferase [Balneolaceae bacterium]|nr:phosphate acyltransferase [Balneolaceae bacterium]
MNVMQRLYERTRARRPRMVLPEASDERVRAAAVRLADEGLCQVILLGSDARAGEALRVLDPERESDRAPLADYLREMRRGQDPPPGREEAHRLLRDPLTFAACLVGSGGAEGAVAGAAHPTSQVIRAALRYIGMRDGISLVSSIFLMELADGRTVTYGDCGVVPYPDEEQLAGIARESARSHRMLTGGEPRVAMLSFSTLGSSSHERADLVRRATERVRRDAPELAVDGEMQFDAALLPEVAEKKCPGSPVGGRATVFVFPNLDAGNIAYKITERLADARATGPILQGLARSMMDLSRGCSADDIVNAACVASVMGEGEEGGQGGIRV